MFKRLAHRFFDLPLLVLLGGLLLSGLVTLQMSQIVDAREQERFQRHVQRVHDAIADRIETYLAMLRGGAGLFAANRLDVSPEAFRVFVDRLEIPERYPGIQGIGYAARVSEGSREGVDQALRGLGAPGIWPDAGTPEGYAILYLEPPDRRNQAAIGYDMFSETVRRTAMERARDTGQPAASGKVQLVQEIEPERQAGFLVYVPVFAGEPPQTAGERARRLAGFVYSPFRAGDLIRAIFPDPDRLQVSLAVYDAVPGPDNLLHATHGVTALGPDRSRYTVDRLLENAGRPWILRFASNPAFEAASNRSVIPFFFGGGVVATLLVSGALWGQSRARAVAEAAAALNRQRARELELINRTGADLAGQLELERLVQGVTDSATELAGAEFGAFFYNVASGGEAYSLYTISGAPREAFARFPMPRGTAIFHPTFSGDQIVRLDDVTADPRYGRSAPHHGMPVGHLPVRSYLAVPVISRSGEVLGALLFGHRQPGVFTERAERIVAGIAAQAAVAIDNARLFQEAQRELAERRRVEAHQQLLLHELNHRVKNTLATVQAIAAQTLRTAAAPQEFQEAFQARLLALSQTHSLLTDRNWEGAPLRDLLAAEFAPYGGSNGGRFHLEGDEVWLQPGIAVALGMALHELTTNAAKHGALSVPDGRIRIVWSVHGGAEHRRLRIGWTETGGPLVSPPTRRGFGSKLIERSLAAQLQGEVKLLFEPSGVRCVIELPLGPAATAA